MRATLRPVHFADRAELELAQLNALRAHVADVSARSPFYRALLQQHGLGVNDLGALTDIQHFPFTTRTDLATRSAEFASVPPRAIIEHVSTSGTTGHPVPFVLSEADLERLAANEANSLASTGITADDIVQITTTLDDRFIAGLAYHSGLRMLGAGILRMGPGNAAAQWRAMLDRGTTALIAVPSFVLRLLEHAEQHDIDPNSTRVRRIICIGEPIATSIGRPNALAERIRARWNVALHGTYASTESATASTELLPGTGHAVQEHLLFTEVLDEQDRPVEEGGVGELVITPLQVEAMPLLRFRTGDVCSWQRSERADGSYGTILGPIQGRKGQRMKIKGTTLFPAQVIDALSADPRIVRFAAVREHDMHGLDRLRVLLDAPADALPAIAEALR
ncbi:MAG TPA: AMP-binding protein, partial [Flavobacteriales bacterium]|nr:AMP-binding protein [Flavobacteriales bacterium]